MFWSAYVRPGDTEIFQKVKHATTSVRTFGNSLNAWYLATSKTAKECVLAVDGLELYFFSLSY